MECRNFNIYLFLKIESTMQNRTYMKFISPLLLVLFFIVFTNLKVDGQIYKWKKLRYELLTGGGVTNFMADVGSAENSGLTKYFWTNPNTWRPVAVVGGRMAFSERHMAKVVLSTGYLYANDAYGAYLDRNHEVRTSITELSAQYEFYIIREQRKRNIYKILGSGQRFKNLVIPFYAFAGVAGVYYNPKSLFDGKWQALRPLNTEILPDGRDTYVPVALAVPFGLGVKFKIAKYISINIEAGWRVAFTDYLDDKGHGTYPDVNQMIEDGDYLRAALTYRDHGFSTTNETLKQWFDERQGNLPNGTSRGAGEWIDQYQFVTATLNFKLKTGRRGQPRLKLYR